MNKTYLLVLGFLFSFQNGDAQVDTVPPALVCKNILPVHLSDFCYGYLKVQALVDTVYDDSQYYELTYRKECTGEGFPSTDSLLFLAGDGVANVELWARDSTGNTSTCKITLFFLDQGFCHTGSALFFTTAEGDGIDSVSTHVYGTNCLLDSMDYHVPTSVLGWGYGWMSWTPGYWTTGRNIMPAAGYNYDVVPSRNNDPLNGVTTYDLTLISKHILGIEPLDTPHKIIAADANQDGKVTTFDIIILRKLILGIIDELPNGKSWRFIPADYVFPNPDNPFVPSFPEKIIVPNTYNFAGASHEFLGIKIGDVNFSADPN